MRKNILPSAVITILLWIAVATIVFFVDPSKTGAVVVFITTLFFTLFFTLSILFVSSKRGLIAASGLGIFIILRYFGLGNILNFFLIAGICIAVGIYTDKKNV